MSLEKILLGHVWFALGFFINSWTREAACCTIQDVKWKVTELEECASTFDEARSLPAWTVVSTRRQTKGRGRFNREWYADEGGLWASFNLPLTGERERPWGLLPLVAGAAVMDALASFHIPGLRLRWPNDVLVEKAKLAGILVERPQPDKASIGVGINVRNSIVRLTGHLQDPPTRLADILNSCPSVPQLRSILGDSLAEVFGYFMEGGAETLRDALDGAWGSPRPVVAITDTERYCGYFAGIESDGSPILRRADGTSYTVPGTAVVRLKELI